jgi:hypothetical protein
VALEDYWHRKLMIAQSDHDLLHTDDTKKELYRVLRIFTDLVMRGKQPSDSFGNPEVTTRSA